MHPEQTTERRDTLALWALPSAGLRAFEAASPTEAVAASEAAHCATRLARRADSALFAFGFEFGSPVSVWAASEAPRFAAAIRPSAFRADVVRPDTAQPPRTLDDAIALCRTGNLTKLVFAHRFSLAAAPRPLTAFRRLWSRYARAAATFLMPVSPALTLVGASPERLVARTRRDPDHFATVALAGTLTEVAGLTDDALLERFGASDKLLDEHRLVVEDIESCLAGLGMRVECGPKRIRRLGRIAHLETPIRARKVEGVELLDVAAALHPTPALCGTPRRAAADAIARLEGARGHYGAPLGFVDADGFGEARVALRTLEFRGSETSIRVGAGLTAASDAATEWAEILAKLATVVSTVAEEPRTQGMERSCR